MPSRMITISTLLILLAVGCGPVKGYPGPGRPASQLVSIQPNPFWSQIGVVVTGVDELKVQAEMSIVVLPGTRTLHLRLQPYSRIEASRASGPEAQMQAMYDVEWQTPATWKVDLQSGMQYTLSGSWLEDEYQLELQDAEKRTVIQSLRVPATRRRP